MNNYSVQYAANLAKLLGVAFALFGVEVADDDLMAVSGGVLVLISIGVSIYDRYKKGDVTALGFRK